MPMKKLPYRPDISNAVGKFTGIMIASYILILVIPFILFLIFLIKIFK
jgi:ABC-type transport system involved in Fe-S cluster assembly fused permease/ATPase subunit